MIALQAAAVLSLNEARAMTQADLVATILGPDHPEMSRVLVMGDEVGSPGPSLRTIILVGAPHVHPAAAGWCERTVRHVKLEPIVTAATARTADVPSRVDRIEEIQEFRLATGNCNDTNATFFSATTESWSAKYALIRAAYQIRDAARGNRPLPFALTCKDWLAENVPTVTKNRCSGSRGRKFLATLPFDHISQLLPSRRRIADADEAVPDTGSERSSIEMIVNSVLIELVLKKTDHLLSVELTRQLVPPF